MVPYNSGGLLQNNYDTYALETIPIFIWLTAQPKTSTLWVGKKEDIKFLASNNYAHPLSNCIIFRQLQEVCLITNAFIVSAYLM